MSVTVDAHQHFWDPATFDYPWMTGPYAVLRRPFGPADLRPSLAEAGVEATILVQTIGSVTETRGFLALAQATDFLAGVVGWVDLTSPSVVDDLADLRAGPGGAYLVAIRHQVHDEDDPDWLARPDVRRGLRAVAGAGLVYDLLVRPPELPASLALARAMPELSLVVDHLAKPPIATGEIEPWASLLRPLGSLPNVACKLSGLVTEANLQDWRVQDLRPYVAEAIEIFGPGRLLAASDWPVCLVAASYERVMETAKALIVDLSPTERAAVLGETASRVYRLSL